MKLDRLYTLFIIFLLVMNPVYAPDVNVDGTPLEIGSIDPSQMDSITASELAEYLGSFTQDQLRGITDDGLLVDIIPRLAGQDIQQLTAEQLQGRLEHVAEISDLGDALFTEVVQATFPDFRGAIVVMEGMEYNEDEGILKAPGSQTISMVELSGVSDPAIESVEVLADGFKINKMQIQGDLGDVTFEVQDGLLIGVNIDGHTMNSDLIIKNSDGVSFSVKTPLGTMLVNPGSDNIQLTATETSMYVVGAATLEGDFAGRKFKADNLEGTFRLSVDGNEMHFSAERARIKYGDDFYSGNIIDTTYGTDGTLKSFILGEADPQISHAVIPGHGTITSTDTERPLRFNTEFSQTALDIEKVSAEKKALQGKIDAAAAKTATTDAERITLQKERDELQEEMGELNERMKKLYEEATDSGLTNTIFSKDGEILGLGKYKVENKWNEDLMQTVEGMDHSAVVYRHEQMKGNKKLKGFTIDSFEKDVDGVLASIASDMEFTRPDGKKIMFKGDTQYLVDNEGKVTNLDGTDSTVLLSELRNPSYEFEFKKNNGKTSSLLSAKTMADLSLLRKDGVLQDIQITIPNLVIAPVSEKEGGLKSLYLDDDVVYVSSNLLIEVTDGSNLADKVKELKLEKARVVAEREIAGALLGEATQRKFKELGARQEAILKNHPKFNNLLYQIQEAKKKGEDTSALEQQKTAYLRDNPDVRDYYDAQNEFLELQGTMKSYQEIEKLKGYQLTVRLQELKKALEGVESEYFTEQERTTVNTLVELSQKSDAEALVELQKIESTNPGIKNAVTILQARLNQRLGNYDEAIKLFKSVGRDQEAKGTKARQLISNARQEISEALQAAINNGEVFTPAEYGITDMPSSDTIEGRLLRDLEKVMSYDKAREVMAELRPSLKDAQARSLERLGRISEAQAIYDEMANERHDSLSFGGVGRTSLALADQDPTATDAERLDYRRRANAAYTEAVVSKIFESDFDPDKSITQLYQGLGLSEQSLNADARAIGTFDKALSYLDPNLEDDKQAVSNLNFYAGISEQKRYTSEHNDDYLQNAKQRFTSAVEANDQNAGAYLRLGNVERELANVDDALAAYDSGVAIVKGKDDRSSQILKSQLDSAKLDMAAGRLLREAREAGATQTGQKRQEVMIVIQDLLTKDPTNIAARMRLAELHKEGGQAKNYEDALTLLTQGVTQATNDADRNQMQLSIGRLLLDQKKTEQAEVVFQAIAGSSTGGMQEYAQKQVNQIKTNRIVRQIMSNDPNVDTQDPLYIEANKFISASTEATVKKYMEAVRTEQELRSESTSYDPKLAELAIQITLMEAQKSVGMPLTGISVPNPAFDTAKYEALQKQRAELKQKRATAKKKLEQTERVIQFQFRHANSLAQQQMMDQTPRELLTDEERVDMRLSMDSARFRNMNDDQREAHLAQFTGNLEALTRTRARLQSELADESLDAQNREQLRNIETRLAENEKLQAAYELELLKDKPLYEQIAILERERVALQDDMQGVNSRDQGLRTDPSVAPPGVFDAMGKWITSPFEAAFEVREKAALLAGPWQEGRREVVEAEEARQLRQHQYAMEKANFVIEAQKDRYRTLARLPRTATTSVQLDLIRDTVTATTSLRNQISLESDEISGIQHTREQAAFGAHIKNWWKSEASQVETAGELAAATFHFGTNVIMAGAMDVSTDVFKWGYNGLIGDRGTSVREIGPDGKVTSTVQTNPLQFYMPEFLGGTRTFRHWETSTEKVYSNNQLERNKQSDVHIRLDEFRDLDADTVYDRVNDKLGRYAADPGSVPEDPTITNPDTMSTFGEVLLASALPEDQEEAKLLISDANRRADLVKRETAFQERHCVNPDGSFKKMCMTSVTNWISVAPARIADAIVLGNVNAIHTATQKDKELLDAKIKRRKQLAAARGDTTRMDTETQELHNQLLQNDAQYAGYTRENTLGRYDQQIQKKAEQLATATGEQRTQISVDIERLSQERAKYDRGSQASMKLIKLRESVLSEEWVQAMRMANEAAELDSSLDHIRAEMSTFKERQDVIDAGKEVAAFVGNSGVSMAMMDKMFSVLSVRVPGTGTPLDLADDFARAQQVAAEAAKFSWSKTFSRAMEEYPKMAAGAFDLAEAFVDEPFEQLLGEAANSVFSSRIGGSGRSTTTEVVPGSYLASFIKKLGGGRRSFDFDPRVAVASESSFKSRTGTGVFDSAQFRDADGNVYNARRGSDNSLTLIDPTTGTEGPTLSNAVDMSKYEILRDGEPDLYAMQGNMNELYNTAAALDAVEAGLAGNLGLRDAAPVTLKSPIAAEAAAEFAATQSLTEASRARTGAQDLAGQLDSLNQKIADTPTPELKRQRAQVLSKLKDAKVAEQNADAAVAGHLAQAQNLAADTLTQIDDEIDQANENIAHLKGVIPATAPANRAALTEKQKALMVGMDNLYGMKEKQKQRITNLKKSSAAYNAPGRVAHSADVIGSLAAGIGSDVADSIEGTSREDALALDEANMDARIDANRAATLAARVAAANAKSSDTRAELLEDAQTLLEQRRQLVADKAVNHDTADDAAELDEESAAVDNSHSATLDAAETVADLGVVTEVDEEPVVPQSPVPDPETGLVANQDSMAVFVTDDADLAAELAQTPLNFNEGQGTYDENLDAAAEQVATKLNKPKAEVKVALQDMDSIAKAGLALELSADGVVEPEEYVPEPTPAPTPTPTAEPTIGVSTKPRPDFIRVRQANYAQMSATTVDDSGKLVWQPDMSSQQRTDLALALATADLGIDVRSAETERIAGETGVDVDTVNAELLRLAATLQGGVAFGMAPGERAPVSAVDAAVANLGNANPFLQSNAILQLGGMGAASLDALTESLNNENPGIRLATAAAILQNPKASDSLRAKARASVTLAPEQVGASISMLGSKNPAERNLGGLYLEVAGEAAVNPLVAAAPKAKGTLLFGLIAATLGEIGSPKAESIIRFAMQDPNPEIRMLSLMGTPKMGKKGVDLLREAAQSKNPKLRHMSIKILADMVDNNDAARVLGDAMKSPDPQMQLISAMALVDRFGFEKVMTIVPKSDPLYNILQNEHDNFIDKVNSKLGSARALMDMGRLAEAERLLDEADADAKKLSIPSFNWLNKITRAAVRQHRGEYNLALRALQGILADNPPKQAADAANLMIAHLQTLAKPRDLAINQQKFAKAGAVAVPGTYTASLTEAQSNALAEVLGTMPLSFYKGPGTYFDNMNAEADAIAKDLGIDKEIVRKQVRDLTVAVTSNIAGPEPTAPDVKVPAERDLEALFGTPDFKLDEDPGVYNEQQQSLEDSISLEEQSAMARAQSILYDDPQMAGFRIGRRIGKGAHGEVFIATKGGTKVAVKILRKGTGDVVLANFKKEVENLGKIKHDNIPSLISANLDSETPFMVQQYIPGESAETRLKRGPMSIDEVVGVALPVIDALDHVHSQGIYHQDVKPGNIVAGSEGVFLVDFGLSSVPKGRIQGTAPFLAPELVKGNPPSADSDTYSLGVTLYNMLSGEKLYEGMTTKDIGKSKLNQDPIPDLADIDGIDVPQELSDIVKSMMAFDPKDRPSLSGAAADLAAFAELESDPGIYNEGQQTQVGKPVSETERISVDKAGNLVGDDYTLERKLGEGATAEVFSATKDGRKVAVKISKPLNVKIDFGEVEISALGQMDHPNIPKERGRDIDADRPYFAQDYVGGDSLETRLKDGPMSESEALPLFEKLADAMAYAHSRGVVHQDLKPANVMVGDPDVEGDTDPETGEMTGPAVVDWGLAVVQEDAPGFSGTTRYASIEQLQGADPGSASDVYALGMTMAEALIGEVPFAEQKVLLANLLAKKTGDPIPDSIPGVSPEMIALLKKMTARNPEDRITMNEAANDLEKIQGKEPSERYGKPKEGIRGVADAETIETSLDPMMKEMGGMVEKDAIELIPRFIGIFNKALSQYQESGIGQDAATHGMRVVLHAMISKDADWVVENINEMMRLGIDGVKTRTDPSNTELILAAAKNSGLFTDKELQNIERLARVSRGEKFIMTPDVIDFVHGLEAGIPEVDAVESAAREIKASKAKPVAEAARDVVDALVSLEKAGVDPETVQGMRDGAIEARPELGPALERLTRPTDATLQAEADLESATSDILSNLDPEKQEAARKIFDSMKTLADEDFEEEPKACPI